MGLRLTNPEYVKRLKLWHSTRWTVSEVAIPTLQTAFLPAQNKTQIRLYPDQEVVFNEMKDWSTCLLEALTGAGKTVMSIALHQAWGGRTLVVCHTLVLAKQFSEEFKKFADVSPTFYCNGKHDQSGEVVVTTMTTFRLNYKLFAGFDNLIIDEADLAMSDKMLKAISSFVSTRKHGFTGTTDTVYDECNPGQSPVLAKFWGKHVQHFSDKKIPLKKVYAFVYNKTYPEVFPHKNWHEFRKVLDDDIDRKRAQIEFILRNTDALGHSLCLWDRVADVEAFYASFKKRGFAVYMSSGEMSKADREQHLKGFKETGGYLLGVSSTLNRGYDNTALTKAFIMHPLKGKNPLRQTIGRIMRYVEGKESFLYLWSDSMLSFQLKTQRGIIKEYFNLDVKKGS